MPETPVLRSALNSALLCAGLLFLVACQSPPEPRATPVATLPALPAAPAAATRYAVRSDLSDVRFLVYRAGPLAALGHHHAIQAGTITGEIRLADDFHRSSFSLALPVADFQVDPRAARQAEGAEFAVLPDAEAIAGTARNMRGAKVLDADNYPRITIRSVSVAGPEWAPDLTVRIALRGVERDLSVPVAIDRSGEQLAVTAVFEIRQTDFGIAPLSVLGGGLQVADGVKVRMRIVAVKT